ncbi:beta-ketoacyl synthase N-terminal-like domain-containing protein, partial [Bacillus mobilis]|uniref:beta-ketoacyl synthase N-terminal-like domain-containing protein n=1 Tax=Bacillus mobilis TaxID=2026190 RepID=UPI002E1EC9F6|nr:beta-ketoacyl synthase N-terminal-like domain-containing protein [Bacillus mobilis]
PTAFRQLIRVEEQRLTTKPLALRYVIFGGEALDPRILKPWFTRHGDQTPQLVNMYGITETTVHVTYRPLTQQDVFKQDSVIGHPIPDLQVYILDENLHSVPAGTIGEMYIGGAGIARGYLNREQLNKERFITNPFTTEKGRLYKTGDLARYNEKHEIEFIGRNDHQVKVRGFRIELGEIEAILNSHSLINDSVVTVKHDDNGEAQIVTYIVSERLLSSTMIREYVRQQVPAYMVPNKIIPVDKIPMNVNGKLDYNALPWPAPDIFNQKKDEDNKQNNNEVIEMITKHFKEVLKLQDINPEEDIFNLGATSLTIVNVAQRIKEKEGFSIPVEVILEHSTISEMATHLCAQKTEQVSDGNSSLYEDELYGQEARDENSIKYTYEEIDVDLAVGKYDSLYYKSYTTQPEFEDKPVNINDISGLLSLLKRQLVDGTEKYLYPSAGGKYAVQTYIYVKENGISDLPKGTYYYHPEKHDLNELSKDCAITSDIFSEYHKEIFSNAKFVIFFVAEMKAIQPFYQKFSHSLVTLDSGYMSQLLLSNQSNYNIGLYPAIGVDFESVEKYFKLKPSHRFIHCLLGGHVDYEKKKEKQGVLIELDEEKLINHIQNPSFINKDRIENMYDNMQYHGLSEEEVNELSKQELQFRKDINENKGIPLKATQYDKREFYARSCQRSYQQEKITLEKLGNFMTLLKSNNESDIYKHLYPSLGNLYETNVYIYINENKVEGLKAGVYKYDRVTHSLQKVSSILSVPIKNCYTPFNRPHLKGAAFCIFLVADLEKIGRDFKKLSLHSSLLEAGHMGQLLMDRQADYDIGLVPIGGVNFEAIRSDFRLSDTNYMIHSFIGGYYENQYKKSNNLGEFRSFEESNKVTNPQQQVANKTINEVAIIGLSGRYPESNTVQELWKNLIDSKNCIREVPLERWDTKEYYQSGIENRNSKSKHGGFLQDIDKFDSLFFGIPPSEAMYLDPQVRIALETVWHALEDAGYTRERLIKLQKSGEKVGVFVGSMYQHYHLLADSKDLQAMLAIQSYSAIANRISHFYNFQGPSVAVDTACSSSLLALHTACESIKRKECTTAVVVGVNLSLHPGKYVSLTDLGLIGSNASSQSFYSSDGFVPGEGVGAVLIKELPQAEEAQDRIYCVVKGSSMNHSGNAGAYSTPSLKAQQHLIKDTLIKTHVSPETISYVESGANGSPIGDSIEVGALTKAFLECSDKKQYCSIGSVKSNIGHLEAASGIAQLTKVILQMKYKTLVPTLQYEAINPFIDFESTPFYLQTKVEKWERPILETRDRQIEYPLRAGVCSFAAGGTNVFAILEEYMPQQQTKMDSSSASLILISARSEDALQGQIKNLREHLLNHIEINIEDVAHTLIYGREHMEVRIALIVETREELLEKLEAIQANNEKIPHVFQGTVTSDRGGYAMFEDDEEYQILLNKWLEKGDLIRISKVWVEGVILDWTKFKKYTNQKIVSLPGYPFARESYWIKTKIDERQESNTLSIKSPETKEIKTGELQFEGYLVEAVSEMLKIPVEKIDFDKSLRMYGFNSLYAMKLVNVLQEKGYQDISAKRVLQSNTIREISDYLGTVSIDYNSQPQNEREVAASIEESSVDEKIIQLLTNEVAKGTINPEDAIRIENRILTTK